MDVERTIEFILQMQAKSEERMAKFDERMAKAEARMDKFDKRMEAMRKLVETGMRMLVKIEKTQQTIGEQVIALTEAQRNTDRKLDRLIDFWSKQRSNGRRPKN